MKFIKKNYILLLQLLFVVIFPILVSTGLLKFLFHGYMLHKVAYIILSVLRSLIILDIIKQLLRNFYRNFIQDKKPEKQTNRRLLSISLLSIFLICEICFMFISQSQDVYKFGLSNYVWNVYYKKPDNEKGFRDEGLKNRIHNKNIKVFFLGDSFTFGHGIKHNKDRFSDIVKDHVSSKNTDVYNLGKGNSDTRDEYEKLVTFGQKPDVLVLQYYLNDIEKIGSKYGHFKMNSTGYENKSESKIKKSLFKIFMLPAKLSFFINYTALNITKFIPVSNHNKYKECITASYSDTLCVNEHKKDIQSIINYCKFYNIKLYVLFIPDMRDIEYTQNICFSKITPMLKSNNIPYIMMDEEFKNYRVSELVVNFLNAHTNEFTHKIIAKKLITEIPELN